MARGKKKEALTPQERLQAALVPESEQPYKVPKNWCWVTLSSTASIIMGQSPSGIDTTEDSQYTPLIGGAADMGDTYPKATRYTKIPTKVSTNQDLILCIRATLGKPVYSDKEYCLGRGVAAIRPHIGDRSFYKYFFNAFEQYLYDNATGTTFAQVSSKTLQQMPLPLPPLSEQQRIVDRIESLFAKLDEAKEKVQDTLDSFETRKAAILHKAFTGELTAQWRKEHGVGMESWRTVTFKDACLKITDGTHHSPVNTPTGEYMYVTAKNIKETGIDLTSITFVSKDAHDEIYSRCDVQYGDVLYIKDGATTGIATVNTIEEPFSLLSSVAVLRPDKKQIMAEYMVYNLNSSKTKAMMINNMSGNAITRLTLSKIKTAQITVCSLDEQAEIVRLLDNLLAKEQQVKEAAEGVMEQIDLLKKAILARAFRGELGTNDPSEESSIKLLKQSFLDTIEFKKVIPERVMSKKEIKLKTEVVFLPKTIMEALSKGVRLTPEELKKETQLPIDDFYAQLKELIDNDRVIENKENGESYLEAKNENRQAEN